MSETGPEELLAEVEESMHDVIDPEIGINVMDLGLVYDLAIRQDEDGAAAVVTMTLTSPACPLQDMIAEQVENATVGAGLVKKLDLSWVWEPAWGPDKITDEGREMMRAVGFTV
ncbi:metal-sulfur cluster biosynthetic enzyme [Mycolicibacter terrae]|jgi:metal-sulfur cluster biosynthetic enzyme|uniref:Metal-sulfur cluster biosynthetic enzyme n=1 Tax=Mycolicibacter terrae TaxID=1788 RepID=A0AAD1HVV3_9MYCO|nr:metal-sulfur cluster assembly factor [Mycolicibacter terrae]ORW96854.1 metal-sulfur cluster biosynthetic enzyme [Mycolicibacter terrae]BBX22472.1 metal-sulfur cluster biosynthetic enzyme [Mycolicibacter terrae]SNV75091.1 metal-sulfur cluster biosynthetic enzyme [Mycolicibacter terrae]